MSDKTYKRLTLSMTQSGETLMQAIHYEQSPGGTSYTRVHRGCEFYKDRLIVLYEYQKSLSHESPMEFYRGYKGILVTDDLLQHHLLEGNQPDFISANCRAHARQDYAEASAIIYSISKTSKLNNLRPYYYFKHLLAELPKLCNKEENVDTTRPDHLLPCAKEFPDEYRKPRH